MSDLSVFDTIFVVIGLGALLGIGNQFGKTFIEMCSMAFDLVLSVLFKKLFVRGRK